MWNQVSDSYSDWINAEIGSRGRLLHDALISGIQNLIKLEASAVVDLGCGDGRVVRQLFKYSKAQVTAVDSSQEMLALAKAGFPAITTLQADLNSRLPLEGKTVDLVICTMVLMYMDQLGQLLNEIKRILVNNGYAIIAIPHPCFFNRRELIADFNYWDIKHHKKTLDENSKIEVLQMHRPLSAYFDAFREAGFQIEAIRETCIEGQKNDEKLDIYSKLPCHLLFRLVIC